MSAEKELMRLRKVPENRICPNCFAKDTTSFGFQAICVAFRTFICSDCKSAHQAFSHRCKSTTMSNWTMEEVRQLDERTGGGNKAAIERWLARVPADARPVKGCHPDVLKQFIERAYNGKEWASPEGAVVAATPPSSQAAAPATSANAMSPVAAAAIAAAREKHARAIANDNLGDANVRDAVPAATAGPFPNLLDDDQAALSRPVAQQPAVPEWLDIFEDTTLAPAADPLGAPTTLFEAPATTSAFSFVGGVANGASTLSNEEPPPSSISAFSFVTGGEKSASVGTPLADFDPLTSATGTGCAPSCGPSSAIAFGTPSQEDDSTALFAGLNTCEVVVAKVASPTCSSATTSSALTLPGVGACASPPVTASAPIPGMGATLGARAPWGAPGAVLPLSMPAGGSGIGASFGHNPCVGPSIGHGGFGCGFGGGYGNLGGCSMLPYAGSYAGGVTAFNVNNFGANHTTTARPFGGGAPPAVAFTAAKDAQAAQASQAAAKASASMGAMRLGSGVGMPAVDIVAGVSERRSMANSSFDFDPFAPPSTSDKQICVRA